MDTVTVSVLISVSLILLTLTALILVGSAIPLMNQASRTLIAYEQLATSVQSEVKPTLKEFKEVVDGFNEIRSLTARSVTEVGHKVEDVADTVGLVAGTASKHSSVLGTGILAGIRAYLSHSKPPDDIKRISQEGGDSNVRLR